ncbi:MAG: hypothetical protein V4787_05285 [Pseudomonadota bacterium]
MDSTVTVADADADIAGNFNNTSITIARRGGASAEDLFENLEIAIGTWTNSGGMLVIHFNALATQAEVNALLSSLTYGNSSDSHTGPIYLDWIFTNVAGTSVTHTTVAEYQAIGDAPTAQDNILAMPLAPRAFDFDDFHFADVDGDTLYGVTIDTVPASGTLTLSGVPVAAGDTILAADISASNLVYTPGSATGSFTFRVVDNGNESGPVVSTTHTFTFQVSTTIGTSDDDAMSGSAIADALSAGSGNDVIHGLAGDDSLDGGKGRDILVGGAGSDTLIGGRNHDAFVFDNTTGVDTIADFRHDKLVFDMSELGPIGDGDTRVEGKVNRASAGQFSPDAEVVVFNSNFAVADTAVAAAAVIGSARSAYAAGDQVVFAINDGAHSAVYLFHAGAGDALVSASELTLMGVVPNTRLHAFDFVFQQ